MPWRFRRESSQAAGPRREFAEPLEPQPPLYRSPTLKALVSRLSSEAAYHILDLGVASGANVEFFSRFSCRLQIADLPDALASEKLQILADGATRLRRSGGLLPVDREPFDVVLAWDVLNYLTRDSSGCLAAHAGRPLPAGRADAGLHLDVEGDVRRRPWSSRSSMTRRFSFNRRRPPCGPARVSRRPRSRRLMSGFAVVQSVVMRHGVQEYLLVRRLGTLPWRLPEIAAQGRVAGEQRSAIATPRMSTCPTCGLVAPGRISRTAAGSIPPRDGRPGPGRRARRGRRAAHREGLDASSTGSAGSRRRGAPVV